MTYPTSRSAHHPKLRLDPVVAEVYRNRAKGLGKQQRRQLALRLLVASGIVSGEESPEQLLALHEIQTTLGQAKSGADPRTVFEHLGEEASHRGELQAVQIAIANAAAGPTADKKGKARVRSRTCRDCGETRAHKGSAYCKSCALLRGYRECPSCRRLFLPEQGRRFRRCYDCRVSGRLKPRSGTSIHATSGGLPTLGKR